MKKGHKLEYQVQYGGKGTQPIYRSMRILTQDEFLDEVNEFLRGYGDSRYPRRYHTMSVWITELDEKNSYVPDGIRIYYRLRN